MRSDACWENYVALVPPSNRQQDGNTSLAAWWPDPGEPWHGGSWTPNGTEYPNAADVSLSLLQEVLETGPLPTLPLGDRLPRHLEARRKARQKASSGSRTRPEGSHWDGGPHPTLGAIATGIGMRDQELFAQRGANLVPGISLVKDKRVSPTICFGLYENQRAEMRLCEGVQPTISCGGGKAGQGSNVVLSEALEEEGSAFLYENHPQDSRVTGPREVSPACTAQWGTGGCNTPLVLQSEAPETFLSQSSNTVQSCWCMPIDMRSLCRRDSAPNAGHGLGDDGDPSCTLATSSPPAVSWTGAVRRLIPVECERLQGFPDGWTAIKKSPGKPYADSHRYKAVGNSMVVPVMCWLGRRILEVTADRELRQEEEDALRALQS